MPRQTLKKRSDGRYVCKYHGISFYGKTQSEALSARDKYKKNEKVGSAVVHTFRGYAAGWLPTYKSGATTNNYNTMVSYLNRIADHLPEVPLDRITPSDIKRMYNAFSDLGEGSRRKIAMLTKAVRGAKKRDGTHTVEGTTKTAAGIRTVPLFKPLRDALEGHHGVLLTNKDGKPCCISATDCAWATYNKHLSSIAGRTVFIRQHDCRHTFATMLYDADVDIKTAARWMGHSSEQMILRVYAHLSDKKAKSAAEKVENMLIQRVK